MLSVLTAPGNRSPADFSPLITGIAMYSSAKLGVDVEHQPRFFQRFLLGGMRGVALLPQELGGSQEHPRPHLPPHDVGPLIDQNRQVAIRLDPPGIHGADNRLAGRPHHVGLLQRRGRNQAAVRPGFQPVVRHHGTFLGKPLHMLRLFLQEAQRDKQREIGVLVPRLLEHPVEHLLHVLPDGVAPRLDDHATAHIGRLGQIGRLDHFLIPLGVVFFPCGTDGGARFGGHERSLDGDGTPGKGAVWAAL